MENKMKDSGIDFIGLIPLDWDAKRIKYETTFINGNAFDSNDLIVDGQYYVIRIGDIKDGYITLENALTISENTNLDNYKIKENDILLAMSGATVGKTGLVKNISKEMYANQRVGIIRTNMHKSYLSYLLRTKEFYDYIQLASLGSAQPNISTFSFGNYRIPLPSIKEQNLIAQYLDEKVPQIENVIDVIKKEIEVLEMTKKSIITECVTKGLNSDVEMKDSGIKYLDKCPITWEIKRLKYLCKKITDGSHQSPTIVDFGKKYITVSDVYDNKINRNQAKEISEEDFKKLVNSGCQPQIGDVLLSKDGTVGRTAIVDNNDCVILSSLGILTSKTNILSKFLKYSLDSNFLQEQMLLSKMGSALQRITITKIKEYYGIIPPIEKQQEIVDYLDKKIDAINRIIDTKKEQISKLETHKQSLIYDYVTGKKRVKGVE